MISRRFQLLFRRGPWASRKWRVNSRLTLRGFIFLGVGGEGVDSDVTHELILQRRYGQDCSKDSRKRIASESPQDLPQEKAKMITLLKQEREYDTSARNLGITSLSVLYGKRKLD